MKRKDYQKPEMQIVVLTRRTCLLQASAEASGNAGLGDYDLENPQDI